MNSPGTEVENSSNNSTKRKPTSPASEVDRVVKRRAARACQSCRTRKVRCDILVNGTPCTNCKLDSLDCILLNSRRGRADKPQKEGGDLATAASPGSTRDVNVVPTIILDNQRSEPTAVSAVSAAVPTDDVPVCLTFDDEDFRDVTESRAEPDDSFEATEAQGGSSLDRSHHASRLQMENSGPTKIGLFQPSLSSNFGPESASTSCHTIGSALELDLPSFIKPLPINMDAKDLQFLASKGAFIVPEAELRAEILRSFIFTVYPFMPILDLREFVEAVRDPDGSGGVSLLLFQAVMFAGLSSLKPAVVQQIGCGTLKQARKTFFTKVRLLYDLGAEHDDTVVLQSLLLMSLWYEKWNERKHTWHWTGLALSLAQSMGLHRATGVAGLPPRLQCLRRRIWWSLYIRDRLIALGTRRPMRIKDDEYDLQLLAIEDFDLEPFDGSFSPHLSDLSIGCDASQSMCLALMCIELTKLCICIAHVLSSQYTTLGERCMQTATLMVVPKPSYERARDLTVCDNELQQWYQNLDPQIRMVARGSARGTSTDSLEIHWSILQMIHQTSVSILHRPQIMQLYSGVSDGTQTQQFSRDKVKEAARKITNIMHRMLRRDQVRFLPTSGVPALLSASLGHMLEIKSKDEDVRDASIFRFYQTMQVLQRLREIYASADSAVSFLASAVRKAGISGPIQLAPQSTPSFMIATTRKDPSGQAGPNRSGPLSASVPPQLLDTTKTTAQLQESRPNPHSDYAGRRSQTNSPNSQAFLPSDNHTRNFHDGIPQIDTNLTHLAGAGPSTSVGATSGASFQAACDTRHNDVGQEQPQGIFASALPDPLSFWVVNEDFFNLGSSLDHAISEDAIELNYNFCSDAFGLLDRLIRDSDENETVTVKN